MAAIQKIAQYNANSPLDTFNKVELFLKSWWSRTYNRPLKDPVLLSYTFEELLYEFHDHIERRKAMDNKVEEEDDRMEEDHQKSVMDWAEQEELQEFEKLKQEEQKAAKTGPTKDDLEWIDKQMQEAKKIHGDTYGEDIEEDFK